MWKERLKKYQESPASQYNSGYKDALGECVHELESELTYTLEEQMLATLPPKEIEEYLLEQEADAYLSSMEAHEDVA